MATTRGSGSNPAANPGALTRLSRDDLGITVPEANRSAPSQESNRPVPHPHLSGVSCRCARPRSGWHGYLCRVRHHRRSGRHAGPPNRVMAATGTTSECLVHAGRGGSDCPAIGPAATEPVSGQYGGANVPVRGGSGPQRPSPPRTSIRTTACSPPRSGARPWSLGPVSREGAVGLRARCERARGPGRPRDDSHRREVAERALRQSRRRHGPRTRARRTARSAPCAALPLRGRSLGRRGDSRATRTRRARIGDRRDGIELSGANCVDSRRAHHTGTAASGRPGRDRSGRPQTSRWTCSGAVSTSAVSPRHRVRDPEVGTTRGSSGRSSRCRAGACFEARLARISLSAISVPRIAFVITAGHRPHDS
jgi:hypothetical protein